MREDRDIYDTGLGIVEVRTRTFKEMDSYRELEVQVSRDWVQFSSTEGGNPFSGASCGLTPEQTKEMLAWIIKTQEELSV